MTGKIIEGAKEALAVARGEQPAARITINGHAYVPEAALEWQPIETAPKDDGIVIWLASFAPGAVIPRYVVQAAWGTAMPSYTHCASFSGWFIDPPWVDDPPARRGSRAHHGILPTGGGGEPTHWMPIPEPPRKAEEGEVEVAIPLSEAQALVDRKYVARADERQRSMGLAYVEAERQDLAKEIAHFTAKAIARQQAEITSLRERLEKALQDCEYWVADYKEAQDRIVALRERVAELDRRKAEEGD